MSNGVRTEWHLGDLTDTEADPFGNVVYSAGLKLDLNATEEELAEQFVALLYREGRMADGGLTCELKDGGQDCLTCPKATLDPEERRSRLCRLGKDQSTVERRCNALRDRRLAPVREVAAEVSAEIEAAQELGELSPELDELLTSVGL